jgi:putative oxidoreductase
MLRIRMRGISMSDQINDRSVNTGDQRAEVHIGFGDREPEAQPRALRRRARTRPGQRLEAVELALHRWLVAHSISLLRVSLGAVFLGFGFLKFFPGVSPAENLVIRTTSILTFDLVPGSVAIVAVAVLECVIGLWLISGRALRGAMYLLGIELIGILAPIVLLGDGLFSGPHHAPTLQGQYVLKDVILVAAVLVIAATVGGGRLTTARNRWRGRRGSYKARQAIAEGEADGR